MGRQSGLERCSSGAIHSGLNRQTEREHQSAPCFVLLFQELVSYLFEPPLISAFSVAPRARANLLPAKRTSVTVALPLACSTTAESKSGALSRATTFAEVFAISFLPSMKLTSTFAPVPSQRT